MHYPNLSAGALNALLTIRRAMQDNPDYLEHDECPYDDQMVTDIKELVTVKTVEKIIERKVEVPAKADKIAKAAQGGGKRGPKPKDLSKDIETELTELVSDLRSLKLDASDGDLKTADRLRMIQVRAQLLEKMATLRQQSTNIRKVSEFMSTVLSVLDDLMDEDTRQEFMKRIEPFAKEE